MKRVLGVLVAVLACGFAIGCGGKVDEKEAEAKAEALMGALEEGLNEEAKEEPKAEAADENPFVGTWQMDLDTMIAKDPRAKDKTEEEIAKMREMFKGMTMNFEIKADGNVIVEVGMGDKTQKTEATWSLLSSEGNTYKLSMLDKGRSEAKEVDFIVNGDKIEMNDGKESQYLMRK